MPDVQQLLAEKFGDAVKRSAFRDNVRYIVATDRLIDVMTVLKSAGFDYLSDIAGIDYLHYPDATDRYGVVYSLANTETAERVYVRVFVNDPDPHVSSVYSIWKGADWMEREVFDMYGIVFDGHPDLRRILMPDGFTSYPLRKDYPLRGRGERHNFQIVTRAES
ncbi:MAG TPA: NADH-quinone oxidoreductase subunit C [Gemmataceae bacterium]|jgi:NADH-quinone oxidoreductase subunit C|nr:NADH-quinone oxidoreductase subunit C [Gemmataceae bacterium]